MERGPLEKGSFRHRPPPGLAADPESFDLDRLFAPFLDGPALGLAVSGGPDSLALMLLAARWAESREGTPKLFVYTVDHGLRPSAAHEAREVVAAARGLGLPARVLRWEGDKPATGVQAGARAARYRLIGAAMAADGAEVLLTAHHAEDQAETVLMRLAHGSGTRGLGGMAAEAVVEGVRVARPLLGVSRAALAGVVAVAGLVPADDPSNRDERFERVRWRRLLPALAAEGLDAARLGRFAERMREAEQALEAHADLMQPLVLSVGADGQVSLDRAALAALPRDTAVRLLRRALALAAGRDPGFELAPLETLAARLAGGGGFAGQTLAGCTVRVEGGEVRLRPEPKRRTAR